MSLEIERKFLVPTLPWDLENYPHVDILQWYFTDASSGKSIRVRKMGDDYTLTKKKWYGLVREEIETPITKDEFDQYRFQVEWHFVEKTRYFLPYPPHTIELNVYQHFDHFVVAEVEFASKRDAKKFIIPNWFGEELTAMREASNQYIANYGLSEDLLRLLPH